RDISVCVLNTHALNHCVVFFASYADPRDLHSFPTRRSSDLGRAARDARAAGLAPAARRAAALHSRALRRHLQLDGEMEHDGSGRSEEHTSELQSPYDLVCRLLLEKKKTLAHV